MGQGASKLRFQKINATYANDKGLLLYIKRLQDGKAETARVPIVWMSNANGEEIPAVYLQSDWDCRRKYTIIYSHAEAEDLGIAASDMSELVNFTGCDVLCYEYSGFGLASGEPSESNCYADIRAAYEYLVRDRGVDPLRIILYGKSLGTGPTVELASKEDLAGVILVSSFLSLSYNKMLRLAGFQRGDSFSNIDKIHKVKSQVLIVHGMRDRVAPYGSVLNLFKKAPNKAPPAIVPFADHDNISTKYRYEVLPFVKRYLEFVSPPIAQHVQLDDSDVGPKARLSTNHATGARTYLSESEEWTFSMRSDSLASSRHTQSTLSGGRNSRESFSSLNGNVETLKKGPSLNRAREKFWSLLATESDDESIPVRRRASESESTKMKRSFIGVATQSQRTKVMVDKLEEQFESKLSPSFLLQCLRVRRFDVEAAAEVARQYRKMMKTLGCHPKLGVSIYDVEMMLRKRVFWASPDCADKADHATLCISTMNVVPKQENWLPTLMTFVYMLSFLHENEETQIRGIAVLLDLRGESWGFKHRDFWRRLFRATLHYYPCRLKRLYALDNGGIIHGHFGLGRLAGKCLHRREVVEVKMTNIVQYFARSKLPAPLGGLLEANMVTFVESRKRLEELRHSKVRRGSGGFATQIMNSSMLSQDQKPGWTTVRMDSIGEGSQGNDMPPKKFMPTQGAQRNKLYRLSTENGRGFSIRRVQSGKTRRQRLELEQT